MSKAKNEATRFILKTKVTYEKNGEEASYWATVGSAWHRAANGEYGESLSLRFDALPLSGEVRGFLPDARDEE